MRKTRKKSPKRLADDEIFKLEKRLNLKIKSIIKKAAKVWCEIGDDGPSILRPWGGHVFAGDPTTTAPARVIGDLGAHTMPTHCLCGKGYVPPTQ